jgi:hypothetical protein
LWLLFLLNVLLMPLLLIFNDHIMHRYLFLFLLSFFLVDNNLLGLFFLVSGLMMMYRRTCGCVTSTDSRFLMFILLLLLELSLSWFRPTIFAFFVLLCAGWWSLSWCLLLLGHLLLLWGQELLSELCLEISGVKVIKHSLIFHQLDLEVLIGLVVIGNQVVDSFEERGQTLAVIFFLKKEFFLGEYLNKIH